MANQKVNLTALKSASGLTRDAEPDERAEPHTRFTVDLPDSDHQFLRVFAVENRMSMSDAMRGVVKLMREQEELATMVRQRAKRL